MSKTRTLAAAQKRSYFELELAFFSVASGIVLGPSHFDSVSRDSINHHLAEIIVVHLLFL
jgi:hypothetical protein